MKLCQKCLKEVSDVAAGRVEFYDAYTEKTIGRGQEFVYHSPVPESKCEFWAHKELREMEKSKDDWKADIITGCT